MSYSAVDVNRSHLRRVAEQVLERDDAGRERLLAKVFEKLTVDALVARTLDGATQSGQEVPREHTTSCRTSDCRAFRRPQHHANAVLPDVGDQSDFVGATAVDNAQQSTDAHLSRHMTTIRLSTGNHLNRVKKLEARVTWGRGEAPKMLE